MGKKLCNNWKTREFVPGLCVACSVFEFGAVCVENAFWEICHWLVGKRPRNLQTDLWIMNSDIVLDIVEKWKIDRNHTVRATINLSPPFESRKQDLSFGRSNFSVPKLIPEILAKMLPKNDPALVKKQDSSSRLKRFLHQSENDIAAMFWPISLKLELD